MKFDTWESLIPLLPAAIILGAIIGALWNWLRVIAGIDFSTHAVDIVLLDEDTDRATWHRFELKALGPRNDAFERARNVRAVMRPIHGSTPINGFWDDVVAIGIEQPRGRYGTHALMRIQGAILSCLPPWLQVQPWNPAEWRKAVGLPGNCDKGTVADFAMGVVAGWQPATDYLAWPQDAYDAVCIALATRQALHREEAA